MSANIITITRGDTCEIALRLTDPTDPTSIYFLEENDVVYFGVTLPHQHFEDAMLKQKYTYEDQDEYGYVQVKISADTSEKLRQGIYYYTAKLKQHAGCEDETITTLINKTRFVVND